MSMQPYFTSHNRLSLVCNGPEFVDTCCRMVAEAREKILFHTYAFAADEVTEPFIEALVNKAREGVQVFMIIDAIGSGDISRETKHRLKQENIKFCYFSPILSKRFHHIGRRLHQKLLLIDNHLALVGGINHSQHFIQPKEADPWLDYAALLEGEEVFRLQQKVRRLYEKYFPEHRENLDRLIRPTNPLPDHCVLVRTTVNDFMRFKSEVYQSHLRAIREAKRSIQIFATYFLPGKRLLKELKRASRRGVRVELIFGALSDHPTERWCSRYLYSWYLKNGMVVYEWEQSVLHGKVTLIDDEWVSIGSYNHNHLSRYTNLELNLEVLNRPFGSSVKDEVERIKSACVEITEEYWRSNTTFLQSVLYFSTYMLLNLITALSTVVIIRHKEKGINR